jgi:hypothetical protein
VTPPAARALRSTFPTERRSNLTEKTDMRRMRDALHHMLNPLHMYCRLKGIGVGHDAAHKMCRAYERYIFRLLP